MAAPLKVLVSQGLSVYTINPVVVGRVLTEIYGPDTPRPMTTLISTGLPGVDAVARSWAADNDIPIKIHAIGNPNDFGVMAGIVALNKAMKDGEPDEIARFHVRKEWFGCTCAMHYGLLAESVPSRRFLVTDEWIT